LVEFEDLDLLDARDLRAVMEQVSDTQVVDAFVGTAAGLRQSLLSKLPIETKTHLETAIAARGSVPFETVRLAQDALVDALRRLGDAGLVAFDNPEDMVA
jgi:flagellar motor switch protein FliG